MAISKFATVATALTVDAVASGAGAYAYAQYTSNHFKVERIIDGDTIDVSKNGETTRVRLLNIDTPEVGRNGQPSEFLAEEATEFLQERIPAGTTVKLEYDQERTDKYGRTLAGVYAGNSLINAEIAREGLGTPVLFQPNGRFYPEVQEASRAPIASETGIFGVSDVSCMTFDEEFLQYFQEIESETAAVDPWSAETYDDFDAVDAQLLALEKRAKSLKFDHNQVTDYQHLTYGEQLDKSISYLQGQIKDEQDWSEVRREAKKRADEAKAKREEKERRKAAEAEAKKQAEVLQEAERAAQTQTQSWSSGNSASNGGDPGASTPGNTGGASSNGGNGLSVDKYTGCRAYGGNYAPNAVDSQGRPYTKINCVTKTPI